MFALNIRGFYLGGVNLTHPSGTSLELLPRHVTISPSPHLFEEGGEVSHDTSFHLSLTSPLNKAEIFAIAREVGWLCQDATRGPGLPLIEVYVEGRYLFEVLTPEAQLSLETFVAASAYFQRDPCLENTEPEAIRVLRSKAKRGKIVRRKSKASPVVYLS